MNKGRNLPLEFIRVHGLVRKYEAWRRKQIRAQKVEAGRAGARVRWPPKADPNAPILLD